ncbi:MAG: Fic family protein [Planctomycetes bacterium]|nr:Fic family protein [Planctomycetota bacterium]
MDPKTFGPSSPGRLVEIGGGTQAFVPHAPPRGLSLGARASRSLGEARAALGAVDEGARALPRHDLLFRPFQKREAILSSRIEGTRTTLDESFVGDATDAAVDADAREVRNYETAMQLGLVELRKGRPLSVFVVRDLHRELLSGVRGESKQPGEFRDRQVWIGSAGRGIEAAVFVPPPPSHVGPCLDELDAYLRGPRDDDPLVRAAIAHWHFETVHPFLDGNGRVGRLLIVLQGLAEGVMEQPWLYVSPAIERRRDEYYDGLDLVRRTGDFESWIVYFAEIVASASRETLDRLRRLHTLDVEFRARLVALRSPGPLKLLPHLFANPYVTVATTRRHLGVATARSAQLAITHLIDQGILEPVEERRRGARGRPATLYRCRALLDVLRE